MSAPDAITRAAMLAFGDTEIVGGPPSFTERAMGNAVRAVLEASRHAEIVAALKSIGRATAIDGAEQGDPEALAIEHSQALDALADIRGIAHHALALVEQVSA